MRKLGIVGVVLLGLYFVVLAGGTVVYPVGALLNDGKLPAAQAALFALAFMIPGLVYGVGGALLIVKRQSLTDWLIEDTPLDTASDYAALLRLGLIMFGLVLIVGAVPRATIEVLNPLLASAQNSSEFGDLAGESYQWRDILLYLLYPCLSLLSGGLLIGLSANLARWLWRDKKSSAAERPAEPNSGHLPRCPVCETPYDPADYDGGFGEPRCVECKAPLPLDHA